MTSSLKPISKENLKRLTNLFSALASLEDAGFGDTAVAAGIKNPIENLLS